jgi:tRNA(fMet)-specific endonuclease VapC
MICLDSDFIIANLRGDDKAVSLARILETQDVLVTTSINQFEVLSGAMLSAQKERRTAEAKAILDRLEILPFGKLDAELTSRVYSKLTLQGKMVSQKDLFIGCIALSANSPILTRNIRDFKRIPDLKVITW